MVDFVMGIYLIYSEISMVYLQLCIVICKYKVNQAKNIHLQMRFSDSADHVTSKKRPLPETGKICLFNLSISCFYFKLY